MLKAGIPDAETLNAHNTSKIQRMYNAGDISEEGAISLLMTICDLEETIAENEVFSWQNAKYEDAPLAS